MFIFFSSPCTNSGDTDTVTPVTSTRYSMDALKLQTVKPWRAWYDDGQVNCCKILHITSIIDVCGSWPDNKIRGIFNFIPSYINNLYFLRNDLTNRWGGWTQEYAGLTFVAVREAGDEVPLHRPKLALTRIKAYQSGTSMPALELVSDSWMFTDSTIWSTTECDSYMMATDKLLLTPS